MKNIVILAQTYYPNMSPTSAVIDKYIQTLKGDYKFYIIAWESGINFKELNDPYINISYIKSFWWHLRIKCEERLKNSPSFLYSLGLKIIRLRTFLLSFCGNSLIFKWVEEATLKELKKTAVNVPIDAIISVSGLSVYSHNAAMRFKKSYPATRWLTFVTDPITFADEKFGFTTLFNKRFFKKSYHDEKAIYDAADYNIFLENLYEDAIVKFDQPSDKTIHFRFVLDDISSGLAIREVNRSDMVRMIYAGTLYREIRNPDHMLSVLSKVENVQLDMYVRYQQCLDVIKKYESDYIRLFPGADNERYKEMICNEYDVLINIGNNCKNQLPSKTLELLSTGKPIINFYYFKDAQYEMIERYPLGLNIGREETDADEKVAKFCSQVKGKRLTFEEVENLFPENSLLTQKMKLKSLIEN